MKRTFLTLCVGIIIGMLVGATSGAFAAIGDKIEAVFAKYEFIVNGEQVELDADPLVYQGSTYLPVRSIMNVLGYDVGYLAESRTITADKTIVSLLEETEKVFNKEVDVVVPDKEGKTIQEQLSEKKATLKELNSRRESLEAIIRQIKETESEEKEWALQVREDILLEHNKAINQLMKEIDELEAQLQTD